MYKTLSKLQNRQVGEMSNLYLLEEPLVAEEETLPDHNTNTKIKNYLLFICK